MQSLSIADAKLLVKHVAVRLNEPVMLWGGPGTAKTMGMAQVAEEEDMLLCDVRLGQYDSVDLRGIPEPDRATRLTTWFPASTLPFVGNAAFPDDRLILLTFDEINAGTQSVLGSAYQIIQERRLGETLLKPNVRIVAMGNRETDRGVTNRMPLPLANRFTHAEVVTDVDVWCQWAQSAGLPAVGIAFYQFRKPLLNTFDPSKPDKTFGTPRTTVKMLNYYTADMPAHIKQAAMAGAVGDGIAAEFWGFVGIWQKMIPLSQIIKDPHGTSVPEDLSMCYAVAVNISGSLTRKNAAPLCAYLSRLSPEFEVLAWQLAMKRDPDIHKASEFTAHAKRLKAVYQ